MIFTPKEASRIIEAALFAATKPLSCEDLLELVGNENTLELAIMDVTQFYHGSHIDLCFSNGQYYFKVKKTDFLDSEEEGYEGKTSKIEDVSLQVLSVIAFHQPVTQKEIDEIRKSTTSKKTLDRLVEMELVERELRKSGTGRAIVYTTSEKFLEFFGLDNLDELPDVSEIEEMFPKPARVMDPGQSSLL